MRLFFSLSERLLLVLFFGAMLPFQVVAQTIQTDEYIYIGVEAEDHLEKDDRWVTTTPSTPAQENDPDGNHSDQASGSTYLELLPDMRVTHEDTFGPPTAYWARGGQGPHANYEVDFPEAGRYYVHVRAYSTGTEDNGMHVGIDGTWPDSGQRMQFCSASRRAWWWGSAQRDAGGNGSCGTEKTIWLDVDSAGTHTVNISAREDGFEIDRFALIKDLSDNTRICSPKNISEVSCRNGSIESADGFIDLRVRLTTEAVGADPEVEPPNPLEIEAGDEITLTAKVENLDAFDTATDIVMTLSPGEDHWDVSAMDDRCIVEGAELKCAFDELHPTAPDENESFVFTLRSVDIGNLRIDASVLGAEVDETPGNDVAATVIKVLLTNPSDLELALNTDQSNYETGESITVTALIRNLAQIAADAVSFTMPVPNGLAVKSNSLPPQCAADSTIQCEFSAINANSSERVEVELIALSPGLYTLEGNVSAINDENPANNLDSVSLSFTEPEVETTTQSTDSGETTSDTSGGTTAGGSTDDNGGSTAEGNTDTIETTSGTSDGSSEAGSTDSGNAGTTDGSADSSGTTSAATVGGTDSGDTLTTGGSADSTGGTTDGSAGSTDDGGAVTTDGNTDNAATTGESSGGDTGSDSTDGASAGTSDEASDTTTASSSTSVEQPQNQDSGAATHWFALLLMLFLSARLYRRHERQRIPIG